MTLILTLLIEAVGICAAYYCGYQNGKKAGRTRVVMDGQDMGALNGTLRIDRVHCDRCMDTGLVYGTEHGLRVAVACPCRKTAALPGAMNLTFEV